MSQKNLAEWLLIIISYIFLAFLFGMIEFNKPLLLTQVLSGVGGAIGIYLLYLRLKTTDDIKEQQDKHFVQDNKFKSLLESTKLLTDKDSSLEAKVSALFLLYHISKVYTENIAMIVQVINKQLTPLFLEIEEKYKTFSRADYQKLTQTIKEWEYKGGESSKLIAISLRILKKIFIGKLQKTDNYIDFSNTILFDINTLDNKYLKFNASTYPIENLIFINCNLSSMNFKDIKLYYGKFLNCNLSNCIFDSSNLWGTVFSNCNLKDTEFKNTECEGVEFYSCENLTENQVLEMRFKNKEKSEKEYLIIISDNDNKYKFNCFKDENKYKQWKNEL